MYKSAIVLAAGKGTRMKSKLPKVLHKVCGKEMINQVIDTLRHCEIDDLALVIGNQAEEVLKATKSRNPQYFMQEKQLGTGDAVIRAKDFLKGKKGTVGVFAGDAPLITKETIERLMKFHEESGNKATILSSVLENSTGYGRIVRNEDNSVEKIVEHKDCSEKELQIKEVNSAIYAFDIEMLLYALDKINNNNTQGEYYLTDVIYILKEKGEKVGAMIIDHVETLGINSRLQLSEVESIMQRRINNMHMLNGVTIIDPKNTYINSDVVIENDVTIYPGVFIEGTSKIGEGCILRGNTRIKDSIIGKNTLVENSVVCDSKIGDNTSLGPFAYIRPESSIGDNVKIGDFVEIKKSTIGNDTKVSHLTYIGDAEVGERCNFGCGSVVVNYDGKNKHKTIVGDDAFIGCNTNLVSPVEVEENAYIAAGSTITKKVEKNSLAIARAKQIEIKDWVTKKNGKK